MIYWALLLHFYQPPTQTCEILEKICDESYRPLVKLMSEEPQARLTVNIGGVLTEMLQHQCMGDVVSGLRTLSERGQIEFTGSAKYHPILPLIPQGEMVRQIELNYDTNHRYFGESYAPKGFFPPEMAYGKDIVRPVMETGHDWIILSGIACSSSWPTQSIYEIPGGTKKLVVFFRDDILSNKIAFKNVDAPGFIRSLKNIEGADENIYVVTAMDAETFGHHIKNWEAIFLKSLLEKLATPSKDISSNMFTGEKTASEIKLVTVSELLALFPKGKSLEPRPSSWSTSINDIENGNPYPLWNSGDNAIHQYLWRHLWLAIELTDKAVLVARSDDAREHAEAARNTLDGALHSDPFWWASYKPVRNLSIIHRGLSLQSEAILNAYRAIKLSSPGEKECTECYYRVIAANDLRNKITDSLIMG